MNVHHLSPEIIDEAGVCYELWQDLLWVDFQNSGVRLLVGA